MTPEERLEQLRGLARTYAKARAEQGYLEDFRKSKLAILSKVYMEKGCESVAAQEREARSDPEYLQVLQGLREATEKAEAAYWELKIAEWGVKIWQSKQATTRAEMNLT